MDTRFIIIFDGVCNLCNNSVHFIIKRDPQGLFAFTPMQSETAKSLIAQYFEPEYEVDTFMLFKHKKLYLKSDAALEVVRDLNSFWPCLRMFKILPKPLRDFIYNQIAKNRYRLFGKRETCMVPTAEIQARFIHSDFGDHICGLASLDEPAP